MKNSLQGTSLLALVFAILFTGSLWADASPSAGKITFDRYYTVEFQDQRCGYARTAVRESADQITSLTYLRITLRQLGQDMLMVFKSTSHETPDGKFISMDQTLYTNGAEIAKTALLDGQDLVVTTTLFGRQVVERFPIPPDGFVTESAAETLIKPLLDKPGQRLKLTVLSLEGGSSPFLPMTLEVIGPETISAYGQAVSATKVAVTVTMGSVEFSSISWCDREGPIATRMQFGGFDIFLCAASKAQARKPSGGANLDIISRIVPKVPLTDSAKARRAVYRLKLKDPQAPMADLPQTDMQQTLARGADYVDIEVIRQDHQSYASVTAQQVPPELAKYLKSTLYLDWRTPSVTAAARQVPCDSDKPWDVALALWKYVDQAVYTKSLGVVYFDPASKVLASGKGDCTEHAVLLGALARARGLPSRIVVGLTQVPASAGRRMEFGYHAWTEVWIDGTWVSLDAALRQAPVDVGHIALGVSAADGSDPLRGVSAGLAQMIGNLQIEVLQQE
ncbi:MAG: hypothetical protein GWP14_00150 [Actinobacteria bacterium]|nr:hypothetical protein [Actinomycetota bacterium]